jgi:alkylmercury lyase
MSPEIHSPLERAKSAWARTYGGLEQEVVDRRVRGFSAVVRGIARVGAVSPEAFATDCGVDLAEAQELFAWLQTQGAEFDEGGNIVGAALSTRPTPHAVRIPGREALYAWCALDTLFIPGLLGEAATIESSCAASGEAIRLSVSPSGPSRIVEHSPEDIVLSVVLPASSGAPRTGPASPT